MSNCSLRGAIGARAAMIMSCGELRMCIYGDCVAAAETSQLPYVCVGVPVVLIDSQTLDDRHVWSWDPLPGGDAATPGVISQIESTLSWGRDVDDDLRRHLAAPKPAARVGKLLAWVDDDDRTAPTRCLRAWAERHAIDALVGQLIGDEDDDADDLEPAWVALQGWLSVDMGGHARLQVFEQLLGAARRSSDRSLARFVELVYEILGVRLRDWAEQRRSGYESSSELDKRLVDEQWMLELIQELPRSSWPRGRRRLGNLEHELCHAWTAAHEAGALDAQPACGRADPPALSGGCNMRATNQSPSLMFVLLLGLWWSRQRGVVRPAG